MDLKYSLRMIKRKLTMYLRKFVNQLGLEIIKSNDLQNLLIKSNIYIQS